MIARASGYLCLITASLAVLVEMLGGPSRPWAVTVAVVGCGWLIDGWAEQIARRRRP